MTPSEYLCDHLVKLGLCPEFTSLILPDKPAYWYIFVPTYVGHNPLLGLDKKYLRELDGEVFRVLFWSGDEWWHCYPKQFPTAEAAFHEWQTVIEPNYCRRQPT